MVDIICPGCGTVYHIPANRIGPTGRRVRCARCNMEWRTTLEELAATGDEALPVSINAGIEASIGPTIEEMIRSELRPSETAEIVAADVGATVAGRADVGGPDASGPIVVEAEAGAPTGHALTVTEPPGIPIPLPPSQLPARRQRPDVIDGIPAAFIRPKRSTRGSSRPVRRRLSKGPAGNNAAGVAVFVAALAMLGGSVLWRAPIVSAVPNLAGLYRLAGMPINLRGLEFRGVTATRDVENGNPVLIVQGQISNVGGKDVSLPAVRIALRNSGHEVYAWLVEASRPLLGAGDTLPFKARLASPPASADDLTLRFAERTPTKVAQR